MPEIEMRNYTINFGPQHPAAHGVLRLLLEMDGEVVERADPHIGLLHRGTEKFIEIRPYLQIIPYFDRLDYCAMLMQEHAFVLGGREAAGRRGADPRAVHPRPVRRADPHPQPSAQRHHHGARRRCDDAAALDVRGAREADGASTRPSRASGCTPTTTGSAASTATCRTGWRSGSRAWIDQFVPRLDDVDDLLTENRIFKQRTVDIGVVEPDDALAWGFSGPMLRASGVAWDLRKAQPYEVYDRMDFDIPVGKNGDCWDRYLVRMLEMRESLKIMRQCLEQMPEGPVRVRGPEGDAAAARRDEALDGGADPPLQALHRGRARAGRARSTPRSRAARASSASTWSPTAPTSPSAARSARRATCTSRRSTS